MNLPTDPILRELLPEFVEDWMVQISDNLPKIVEERNTDDLYRMGHTIKGSCLQFGLLPIADLGIRLMSLSKTEDWQQSLETGKEIYALFSQAHRMIQEENS